MPKTKPVVEITEVMFRKEKSGKFKGEIMALMPYELQTYDGDVTLYVHVGQHSACDYDTVLKNTVPATEEEYAPLLKELTSEPYNYNFKIIKRRNYDRWLVLYKKSVGRC